MSKIAPCVATYLQQYNTLNLEGFGTFTNENVNLNNEVDEKGNVLNTVLFKFNPKVQTDETFIVHIKNETGKMRPLAIADIDTFVNTGKQLLNISKPFTIDGLGSIVRSSTGEYTFTLGNFEPPKINTETVKERNISSSKEKAKANELSYDTTYGNSLPNNKKLPKKIIGAIVFISLLGSLGFVLYKYVFSKMMETSKETVSTEIKKEIKTDTTTLTKINKTVAQPDSLGRVDMKLVVRTTDSVGAYKRVGIFNNSKIDLLGYQNCTVVKDKATNNYQVVLLLKATLADTAALRLKAKTNYGTVGQEAFYIQ
jgi:hypothetical protein